jgi:hypothetical protein
MSDRPTSQDQGTPSSPPRPSETPPPAADKRSWRKFLTPIVLAILGLALFLFALMLYPSTTELPAPPYSLVSISTRFPIDSIVYRVTQVSSGIARVRISVQLPSQLAIPVPSRAVLLTLAPPPGTLFRNCPHPACEVTTGMVTGSFWNQPLSFKSGRTANADFFVKDHSFGVTFNGVNASASIPEVLYQGTGSTTGPALLFVVYHFPSASSYDWSSYPVMAASKSAATWQEAVNHGDTATREAVGVDHASQASNDNKTFFAGALLGLAGGAILSAVQEALHARD